MLGWAPLSYARQLTRRYGDLCTFRLFHNRAFIANSPELVHQVLVVDADAYQKQRRQMRILARVFGQGLLTSDGPLWVRQRGLIQQAFSSDRMADFQRICREEVAVCVQNWRPGESVNVSHELVQVMPAISGRVFFGNAYSQHGGKLINAVCDVSTVIIRDIERCVQIPDRPRVLGKSRRRRAMETLRRTVGMIMDDMRASQDGLGAMTQVLQQAMRDPQRPLSQRQATDEIVTVLVAGNHTIVASLEWMFKVVASHADVQDRVTKELSGRALDRPAEFQDFADFP